MNTQNELYRFSQWLFNRYIEAHCSPQATQQSRFDAEKWETALSLHIECNMSGRGTGSARQWSKLLLKEIQNNRRNSTKFPLSYYGPEAGQLNQRDQKIHNQNLQRWMENDQAIGILSQFSEPQAMKLITKILDLSEGFSRLKLSSSDDAYICGAFNMLLKVLEANRYPYREKYSQP